MKHKIFLEGAFLLILLALVCKFNFAVNRRHWWPWSFSFYILFNTCKLIIWRLCPHFPPRNIHNHNSSGMHASYMNNNWYMHQYLPHRCNVCYNHPNFVLIDGCAIFPISRRPPYVAAAERSPVCPIAATLNLSDRAVQWRHHMIVATWHAVPTFTRRPESADIAALSDWSRPALVCRAAAHMCAAAQSMLSRVGGCGSLGCGVSGESATMRYKRNSSGWKVCRQADIHQNFCILWKGTVSLVLTPSWNRNIE